MYSYLLRGVSVNRVNQVWGADITYIPMAHGLMYLAAIMDWYPPQADTSASMPWRRR